MKVQVSSLFHLLILAKTFIISFYWYIHTTLHNTHAYNIKWIRIAMVQVAHIHVLPHNGYPCLFCILIHFKRKDKWPLRNILIYIFCFDAVWFASILYVSVFANIFQFVILHVWSSSNIMWILVVNVVFKTKRNRKWYKSINTLYHATNRPRQMKWCSKFMDDPIYHWGDKTSHNQMLLNFWTFL